MLFLQYQPFYSDLNELSTAEIKMTAIILFNLDPMKISIKYNKVYWTIIWSLNIHWYYKKKKEQNTISSFFSWMHILH